MGQTDQSNVVTFPKPRSVQHPAVLRESLEVILRELYTFYDSIPDFVEDCGQAIGHKKGIQADRALHSWARRQLEEYRYLAAKSG